MKHFKIFFAAVLITAAFTMFTACNSALNTELGKAESGLNAASGSGAGVGSITNWLPVTLPTFSTYVTTLEGVISDGGLNFVIIAGYNEDPAPAGAAFTSLGTMSGGNWTWSDISQLADFTRSPSAVNYLNGYYLVTAGNKMTAGEYSANGTTWLPSGEIGVGTKASVYGTGADSQSWYVVGGQNGTAAYTNSLGDDFLPIDESYTGFSGVSSAAYINAAAHSISGSPVFVFGGGSGRIARTASIVNTSTDVPYTWQSSNSQDIFTSTGFINAMVCGTVEDLDMFIAAGQDGANPPNGKIAYSTNGGATWMEASLDGTGAGNGAGFYALAYGAVNGTPYFVAGDDNGFITYSNNGKTWYPVHFDPLTQQPSPVFDNGGVNGLAFGIHSAGTVGTFMAVGGETSPLAYSATVPN